MGFFQKLISIFDGLGSVYETSATTFRQLDVEKVKKMLKLQEEAKAHGMHEQPNSGATSLNDVEIRITTLIKDALNEASELFLSNQRTFEERIAVAGNPVIVEKIETQATLGEADFDKHLHAKDELHHAKIAVINAENSAKKFKETHKREGNANYPASKAVFLALIPLILVGETTFNSTFFAQGSALGLIGGWSVAFIPAALNVVLGYVSGQYAWRDLYHISTGRKGFGIFLTIALLTAVFVLNLLVAHYRSAMMQGEEQAEVLALKNFLSAPFHLSETQSWFLLIVGCLCSLGAAADFFWMDDPYPGFGRSQREQVEKFNQYNNWKHELLDELEAIRDKRIDNIDKLLEEADTNKRAVQSIHENFQFWKTLYRGHLNHLQDVADTLFSYYRTQNQMARKTPPPAYFNSRWTFDRPEIKETIFDLQELTAKVEAQMKKSQDAYGKAIKKINAGYKKALAEYQTIDELNEVNPNPCATAPPPPPEGQRDAEAEAPQAA